jgi:hypothetical protein
MTPRCPIVVTDFYVLGHCSKYLLNFCRTIIHEGFMKANNIHEGLAVKKFITDIEQQYDDKLGFESKVESLQSEK